MGARSEGGGGGGGRWSWAHARKEEERWSWAYARKVEVEEEWSRKGEEELRQSLGTRMLEDLMVLKYHHADGHVYMTPKQWAEFEGLGRQEG